MTEQEEAFCKRHDITVIPPPMRADQDGFDGGAIDDLGYPAGHYIAWLGDGIGEGPFDVRTGHGPTERDALRDVAENQGLELAIP